mmetsp:Transcript_24659/g.35383  ORF Transcript_24659/g.35383 Transcript_24659/m.35383 type:complete len:205 (+) Transcript_24659:91-705(+)
MSTSDSATSKGFDWELLKASSSESSTSPSVPALPRGGSGESGGVVSKRFQLLSIDSLESASVCAGYVGKSKKRFCTQIVSRAGASCSTLSHVSPKFNLVANSFYMRATNQVAFCYPSYPYELIPDYERRESLKVEAKTQADWRSFFSGLERSDDADDFVDSKPSASIKLNFDPSLPLKTPAKRFIDGKVNRIWETELTPYIDVP